MANLFRFRSRNRRFTFQVRKDDLDFEIVVRAPNERVAADKAARIGFWLNLMLIGPTDREHHG